MSHPSHYIFQVVPLLLQCQANLEMTISRINISPGRYEALYQLQRSLVSTEKLVSAYTFKFLREKKDQGTASNDTNSTPLIETRNCDSGNSYRGGIVRALEELRQISQEAKEKNYRDESSRRRGSRLRNSQEPTHERRSFYATKSQSVDSQLLFRLIVIFELLLVRIDDAHYVITGHRIEGLPGADNQNNNGNKEETCEESQIYNNCLSFGFYCLGSGLIAGFLGRKYMGNQRIKLPSLSIYDRKQLIGATAKASASLLSLTLLKGFLNVCWMTDKIIRSNNELLEWNPQWELIRRVAEDSRIRGSGCHYSSPPAVQPKCESFADAIMEDSLDIDDKSRTLIEYAKKHGRKSYFWRSTGEIRFLMLKRFMDIYYASVRVGVHCTKDNPNSFFLPLVTGAAASFYTITGAPTPTVVNESSRDLIQHAW